MSDSLSFFGDKAAMPTDEMLAAALAGGKIFWDGLIDYVAASCGNVAEVWKFYSKKAGWSLVVKSGARTILYLIPRDAFFKASFVLGERAVTAALAAGLPEEITALITEARPYAEGRSFMFDVKSEVDAAAAKKLVEIKNPCS